MKLSHTLGGCTNYLYDREFPMNSVILELDNGLTLVSYDFVHSRKKPLELFCYNKNSKKWVKTFAQNDYTEVMWDYYRKNIKKSSYNSVKHNNNKKIIIVIK